MPEPVVLAITAEADADVEVGDEVDGGGGGGGGIRSTSAQPVGILPNMAAGLAGGYATTCPIGGYGTYPLSTAFWYSKAIVSPTILPFSAAACATTDNGAIVHKPAPVRMLPSGPMCIPDGWEVGGGNGGGNEVSMPSGAVPPDGIGVEGGMGVGW